MLCDTNCQVCNRDISYAGGAYCDGENGFICGWCKVVKSGNRDDFSYISSSEKTLNSDGVEVQNQ